MDKGLRHLLRERDEEIRQLKEEINRLKRQLSLQGLSYLLKNRGFSIYKKQIGDDLILPEKQSDIDSYYEHLKKYSFRLFLRDVIKHQQGFSIEDVTRYATKEVSAQYLNYLTSAGVVVRDRKGFRLKKQPIKSFGETLEWFIAEVLKRAFNMEAIWGVRFKKRGVGGDYDLIARFDSRIVYMEIKSSPPRQIYDNEIRAFLDRTDDLRPDMAVFLMDTELRMKDKIVPMFEDALKKRYRHPVEVSRIEKELFHIDGKVFIINSKDSLTGNIASIISWHLRSNIGG